MKKQEIENIIEESVIIKMKDIPKHMVGIDLTWLDKEIRKIKDRLLSKLTKRGQCARESSAEIERARILDLIDKWADKMQGVEELKKKIK